MTVPAGSQAPFAVYDVSHGHIMLDRRQAPVCSICTDVKKPESGEASMLHQRCLKPMHSTGACISKPINCIRFLSCPSQIAHKLISGFTDAAAVDPAEASHCHNNSISVLCPNRLALNSQIPGSDVQECVTADSRHALACGHKLVQDMAVLQAAGEHFKCASACDWSCGALCNFAL